MRAAAAFIDGSNFYNTCRKLHMTADFKKIKSMLDYDYNMVRLYYYVAYYGGDSDPMRVLADWLEYNAYTVVSASNRIIPDGQDRAVMRSSSHVDIAVDALTIAPHVDHIILFSGDRELVRLVEALKRLGKVVTIVSSLSAGPYRVDDELRRRGDNFLDLTTLRDQISRTQVVETVKAHADVE